MKILNLLIAGSFVFAVAVTPAQAGGDAAAGEAKSATCAGCHGSDFKGMDPNPALAGLDEAYIVEQLNAFKSGARENMMMQTFAAQLTDADIANLAAYLASLES